MENTNQENTFADQPIESQSSETKPTVGKYSPIAMILVPLVILGFGIFLDSFKTNENKKADIKQKTTVSVSSSSASVVNVSPTSSESDIVWISANARTVNWEKQLTKDKPLAISYCYNTTTIPPILLQYKNIEYLDLGDNNLTTLPNSITSITDLKELNLTGNNLSQTEQQRIKEMLPNVKVFFSPQKDFNPNLTAAWKEYKSKIDNYSFRYHPELQIVENKNRIIIQNDFVNFKYSWDSCSTEMRNIKFAISTEDNPSDETPVAYLNTKYNYGLTQQGDSYMPNNKGKAMEYMLGSVKVYKNGDIDGVIVEAGENDTMTIMTSHNNKMYYFSLYSIGQTGSSVSDIAKTVRDQILATFRYTD